jgi:hypothetical protein
MEQAIEEVRAVLPRFQAGYTARRDETRRVHIDMIPQGA